MNSDTGAGSELNWAPYVARYRKGEWRAPIFLDMILEDLRRLGPARSTTVLDIGCGRGFDDEPQLQAAIAAEAGRYLGIEPDDTIEIGQVVETVHHCRLEDAPIEPSTIDLAFAVMVLEHLESPEPFWNKLLEILKEGGVFWGFTIDSRHWFAKASLLAKRLRIKEWYLDLLRGKRGDERYSNYPVHYRSNSPEQIEKLARDFGSLTLLNFHTVGEIDPYLPKPLRWISRWMDARIQRRGLPGSLLAVRAVKRPPKPSHPSAPSSSRSVPLARE